MFFCPTTRNYTKDSKRITRYVGQQLLKINFSWIFIWLFKGNSEIFLKSENRYKFEFNERVCHFNTNEFNKTKDCFFKLLIEISHLHLQKKMEFLKNILLKLDSVL